MIAARFSFLRLLRLGLLGLAGLLLVKPAFGTVREGRLPAPPGYNHDFAAAAERVSAVADSRSRETATGVRVEAHGEAVFVPKAGGPAWIDYGGAVGASVELWSARVLAVEAMVDFADPLLGTAPFTEQVTLGGDRPMRGFLRDRLIDRSAFVTKLQDSWPVWVFLDGVALIELGNVYGARLTDFDAKLLRVSSNIGVRSNGSRESAFEILIGAASDPLEKGLNISSFRLILGTHDGGRALFLRNGRRSRGGSRR